MIWKDLKFIKLQGVVESSQTVAAFSIHRIPEEDTRRQPEEFAEQLQRLGKASPEYVKKVLEERYPAESEIGDHITSAKAHCRSRDEVLGTAMNKFAICVSNEGHEVSLERRKVYEVIGDEKASEYGLIRVIDESGEDYLYPSDFFVRIDLPEIVQEAMVLERIGVPAL